MFAECVALTISRRVEKLEMAIKSRDEAAIAAKDAEIAALKQVAELSSALAATKSPQKTYSSASATNSGDNSLLSSMAAEVERLQEELEDAKDRLEEEKFTHEQTATASQKHVEVYARLFPISCFPCFLQVSDTQELRERLWSQPSRRCSSSLRT